MLPSLTSGCRESVHPGVRGGNMGMSGNKSTVPDNKNHPVLPILYPFLHKIIEWFAGMGIGCLLFVLFVMY